MKKLVMMLVVAAMVAPLMAGDVQFTATDNGDGTATIAYVATGGTVRGMALNVDATAALTGVAVDSFFDVFMDAAYMDPDNYALGAGTPIADQDAAGEVGLSASFCISMGNLEGTVTADEIVLTGPACTGTLDINTLRGAIVDTDGVEMTSNLPITFEITSGPVCEGVGPADQAEWDLLGNPQSWCNPFQCIGDAANDVSGKTNIRVAATDLTMLLQGWQIPQAEYVDEATDPWIAADFDRLPSGKTNVRVSATDLTILLTYWQIPELDLPAFNCAD